MAFAPGVVAAVAFDVVVCALVAAIDSAFAFHALLDVAHRPGILAPELMPRPFLVGCALLNVYVAALCYLARRR